MYAWMEKKQDASVKRCCRCSGVYAWMEKEAGCVVKRCCRCSGMYAWMEKKQDKSGTLRQRRVYQLDAEAACVPEN